jgi:hypothetical protein
VPGLRVMIGGDYISGNVQTGNSVTQCVTSAFTGQVSGMTIDSSRPLRVARMRGQ